MTCVQIAHRRHQGNAGLFPAPFLAQPLHRCHLRDDSHPISTERLLDRTASARLPQSGPQCLGRRRMAFLFVPSTSTLWVSTDGSSLSALWMMRRSKAFIGNALKDDPGVETHS